MKPIKGFTLLEIVFVTTLLAILGSLPVLLFTQIYKSYYTSKSILLAANTTTIGVINLTRELKSAEKLITIGKEGVTFVNQQGDTIAISLSNRKLMRQVNAGTAQVLCANVTKVTFTYYDTSYTAALSPDKVTFINLQINVSSGSKYALMSGTVVEKNLPLE